MNDPDDLVLAPRIRVMQIIVFAMTMALTIFAAVTVYLVQIQGNGRGLAPPPGMPILTLLAFALLPILAAASVIVPANLERQSLRRIALGEWQPRQGAASGHPSDVAKLLAVYHVTMIVGMALVQGAGFFCCIAYLVEGRPYLLILVALALVLQVARFPTQGRVRPWLERQFDRLEQERGRNDSPDVMP